MNGWERLARAFFPGMGKHIDSWNEQQLRDMNVRAAAAIRRAISDFDWMLWELEMEEEDA